MNIRRAYRSQLRQDQVQRTRERILEGLLRALGQNNMQDLSIPAIAREAGVSVPTVYRYFKTKRELIQALAMYAVQKVGMKLEPIHDPESLIYMIRQSFVAYTSSDELLHASMLSEQSVEIRAELFPWRLKIIEEGLAPVAAQFGDEAQHLRNIIFLLTTTTAVSLFKEVLGLSGQEAADTVAWAIRRLIEPALPDHKQPASNQPIEDKAIRSTDDDHQ